MATTAHPYRQNLTSATPGGYGFDHLESGDSGMNKHETSHVSTLETSGQSPRSYENVSMPLEAPEQFQQNAISDSSRVMSSTGTPDSSRSNLHGSGGSFVEMRTNSESTASLNARRSRKSLDLSHLFMLSDKDTQFTATNESVADLSHQMISQYLGEANNSSLVPRLKTIEMYKQNVKKSKDPNVLFQYAQYMLQTALTIDASGCGSPATVPIDKKDANGVTQEDMRKQFLKEAQTYLKKLSVKGYSDAQYLLADAYSSGAFGKVNNRDAFVLFQSAAKHGHVESAFRTAHCFEEGLGTTCDSRRAVEFLKFAASRNHPSAMYKLGLFSFYGRMGLSHDVNTKQNGIKWLSRAAARANELTNAAPYELAKIYRNGFLDIIIPDIKYAMELYIQAASLGHAKASTALGNIYESGNEIVPPDTSLSVHYYTQSALQGEPHAMLGLCAWYLMGAEPAFEKDENEAFQWALKAAKLGLAKAQFTVGYFYEKGKGCEANAQNARQWYEIAAKNNDQRAVSKLNNENTPHVKNKKSLTALNLFSSASSTNILETDNRTPPKMASSHTPNQLSIGAPSNLSGSIVGVLSTTEPNNEPLSANGPNTFKYGSESTNTQSPAGGNSHKPAEPAAFDLTGSAPLVKTNPSSKGNDKSKGAPSRATVKKDEKSSSKKKDKKDKKKDKKCVLM
ncbi:LANO_0F11254g1_1 [Lachancea nothofagi CBS 11611]|uniref:LANO_0F11254g1_1 n=1 Tax=Lachancea nothofagi CBS 11611 TaxID=1266666 RepID=A0A1G4KAS5_9SACH|nr:LANO_0F11254g1_1 [Lachancea nothofagi CBS 11611]